MRADPLGAVLARQVLQRYKRRRADSTAPAKKRKVAPLNCVLQPFNAGGFAGRRPTWVSAPVTPAEVPARGKTPVAEACTASGSVPGFDGGHVIGLHLGGPNTARNVVPMYPRFNRGPWKQLEDAIKQLAKDSAEKLDMTVTIAYGHADPRVPSTFTVEVENADEIVLSEELKQPDDIPGIAPLPAAYGAIIGDVQSYAAPPRESTAGKFLLGSTTFAQHASAGHLPPSLKALYPDKPTDRPYGQLDVLALNGTLVVPGQGTMEGNREFSAAQREVILALNAYRNGGHLVSDDPDDPHPNLSPQGTVNAPEIDHIVPKVLG
ncbi:MAG TPA: DNA/RNA non-specific endonuclease, partial [Solirubrobacteraceae bacterium]|nr:DNA/RNA non-specific endonuclease [Solirubrobacteraceae bacterium]